MGSRFNYTDPNKNNANQNKVQQNNQNKNINQDNSDKNKQINKNIDNNQNNNFQDEHAQYEQQQLENQPKQSKIDFQKILANIKNSSILISIKQYFSKRNSDKNNNSNNIADESQIKPNHFAHTDINKASQNDPPKNTSNVNYKDNYEQQDQNNNIQQSQSKKRNLKNILVQLIILGGIGYGGYYGYTHLIKPNMNNDKSPTTEVNTNNIISNSNAYKYPSEKGKTYPSVYQVTQVNVDLSKQRLYLMHDKKVLYTMLISSGKNNTTPIGNFQIEAQQGKKMYDKQFQRGMNYWQSYNENGKYNFSTLWTNKDGSYRLPKSNNLGVRPSTDNGNIQLTTPDAKYIYGLVIGTPVHIYS